MAAEEERVATSRAFSTYGRTLDMVLSFKYLGRVLSVADDDCPAVIRYLVKARVVWRRMARILIREGARPRVSRFFFKAIVKSVLFFYAETWVANPHMRRVLGGFQDQVARRLTGRLKRRRSYGKWEYTSGRWRERRQGSS